MSESSDSSSPNSDSDGEDLKRKNSSSEEETELPKQLKSSDDDDDDDEEDDGDEDDDDEKLKPKTDTNDSQSASEEEYKKEADSNVGSTNDEDDRARQTERKDQIKHSLFDSDSQDTGDNEARNGGRKISAIRELKEEWDQKPDLYGIRRSGRSRREIVRYNIGNSDSENEGRRKTKRRGSDDDEEEESDDSSGSESYQQTRNPPRRKARPPPRNRKKTSSKSVSKGKSRSRNLSSSGTSEDSDGYSRPISQRKSAQKVSYKEENTDEATDSDDIIEATTPAPVEEEDNRETIERVLDVRRGRKGAIGHKTTVYNVQLSSDPNISPLKDGEREEFEIQYLIKWKNWAHIHNTWETDDSLKEQKVNGMKRFENFLKREEEINEWKDSASPEDIEYYECQLEMMQDLVQSHKKVDRIIAHRKESHGGSDYMCKWTGLPYSDCTWEDGELVSKLFQSHIDQHLARNKSQCIPTKLSRVLKMKPKFAPMKEQPAHLGDKDSLKLRDYQLDGLNWMLHAWCRENSVILADEMGLGKTIQIITFVSQLHNHYHLYGPFLLVVPLSTVVAWQREFEKWAPEINVIVYLGDVSSRTVIREQEWRHPGNKRLKFNALITTYEILLKDKSFLAAESWAFLGVDEAHRLKNDDSLLYRSLETFDTNHRILITGTPLQNSLKELWSLLHFIMPTKFDSWPDFEEKHSKDEGKGFVALHKQLEPFLLRRVKKDVEKSLPAKTEQILRVHLSSLQKTYYRAILQREFKVLMKGKRGNVSSYANIMMELKKCANHAQLCVLPDPDEIQEKKERLSTLLKGSGKLLLLDKLLVRLRETGHRVLIFSQMVRMLDIIAEYLQCRHFPFQRLDGSIRGDLRKQALDHFNAEGSQDFCFLLSTRAGGLGINLATADTVIIFDSDWNPQNDLQAQARAHRIGQTKQVSVYRLVTNSTVEEKIVESAKKKMVLDHLVIQRMDSSGRTVLDKGSGPSSGSSVPFSKEELCAILKFGAEELFKGNENEDDEDQQVDIDDILNRAETHETETHGVGDELLSQFNMASFGNLEEDEPESRVSFGDEEEKDWEDIIPENVRMKMEEEERQQQLLDLELGPRNRKTIKQLQVDYDSDKDKKRKKKHRDSDSDASDEDEDDEDDDQPKRRGRPKGAAKDGVKGFSNAEIRRFVKSYKKFPAPLKRLDAIAEDSELQEKGEADLRRLGEHIKKSCEELMKEHNQKMQENPSSEVSKKSHKGPTFKIASVSINAQALLKTEEDLKPLADAIPDDKELRKKWRIDLSVKKVHWDCFWNVDDDSNLLKGVYEYGMNSWEAIKMDPDLGLSDRILPDGELKPQAKHLQTRVEFLLKSLKKEPGPVSTKSVKPRKRNPKSKAEIIDRDDSSSSDEKNKKPSVGDDVVKKSSHIEKVEVKKENGLSDISDTDLESEEERDSKVKSKSKPTKPVKKPKKEKELVKEEKKDKKESKPDSKAKNKKKQQSGPMHFTAVSEPKQIAEEEEEEKQKMDSKIFDQCKEKMRPLKKVLKQLSEPDESLDEKEQVSFIRSILLKIGDHINVCIEEYSDPDKIKFWRDQLWLFVSNFTTLNHNKLRKLYKGACKKRGSVPKHKDGKRSKKEDHDSKHKNNSMKRSHEGSKEGPTSGGPAKKPHHSIGRNDRSHHKDSSVNSNPNNKGHHHHPRSGGGGHHPPYWSGTAKDGSQLPDSGNNAGSPNNNWTLASPLSRTEDVSRSRFSGDRQGPGGQHYHRDYRGRSEHRGGYRPDPHWGEHYRSEYGNHYRDQGGPSPSSTHYGRSSDRSEDWGGANSDRKRRGDWADKSGEDYDRESRRSHKDPRTDSSHKAKYSSATSNTSSQPPPPGESPNYSHH